MEFNEKLQQLRKKSDLTQEELAEKLFVSRTAISKWESGKGYPNIDSLKAISKFFSVSIDELLSGDELIDIAEKENKSNINRIYNIIYGIMDLLAVLLILLPLYGNPRNGYIYMVNLIGFSATTKINLSLYWLFFILLVIAGILKLIFLFKDNITADSLATKASIFISIVSICFLTATKEPYATTLLFLFFVVKMFLIYKMRTSDK